MTNGNGAPPEAAPPPQLNVLAQYTKDLSFENPNAPASLAPQQQQPAINIQINVSANNMAENEFEVTLSVEGKAENGGKVMFSFDLAYAGVYYHLCADYAGLGRGIEARILDGRAVERGLKEGVLLSVQAAAELVALSRWYF